MDTFREDVRAALARGATLAQANADLAAIANRVALAETPRFAEHRRLPCATARNGSRSG